jgi:hypothetical protein
MSDNPTIRVKFVGNYANRGWMRQFPGNIPRWGRCEFIFDVNARDYDWFIVYNDFPGDHREERLSCPRSQTLLVTMEPPSIKSYGRAPAGQAQDHLDGLLQQAAAPYPARSTVPVHPIAQGKAALPGHLRPWRSGDR